jgi:magnesium chelatase family protein
LPEAAVRESRTRARRVDDVELQYPQRITINLAPADLPKEGGRFDRHRARHLAASRQTLAMHDCEYYGELSLYGELRGIRGALPAALLRRAGAAVVMPVVNGHEAALSSATTVLAASSCTRCAHICGRTPLQPVRPRQGQRAHRTLDLSDVRQARETRARDRCGGRTQRPADRRRYEQEHARADCPASCRRSRKPKRSSAAIRSACGLSFDAADWRRDRFARLTTASAVALVGGGVPRPGESARASRRALLDELPEFDRRALGVLREPPSTGACTSRARPVTPNFPRSCSSSPR